MGALTNKTLSATYQASNVFSYTYDEGRVGASYNLSLGGLGTNMASATATYVKVTSLHFNSPTLSYPTLLYRTLPHCYVCKGNFTSPTLSYTIIPYRILPPSCLILFLTYLSICLLLLLLLLLLLHRWDWHLNFPQ